MEAWINSDQHTETVSVRDDGQKAKAAEKDEAGNETMPAVAARKAWPVGAAVEIRRYPSGDDMGNFGYWARLARQWRIATQDEETADQMADYDSGVAVVAVMAVRCTGKIFTDPDTGNPFVFEGTPDERMARVRRLPHHVISYVAGRIAERMSADPLA